MKVLMMGLLLFFCLTMKKIEYLAAALFLTCLASCGTNAATGQVDSVDTLQTEAETLVAESPEYDKAFFDVKGPVKRIVEWGETFRFNRDGMLVGKDDGDPFDELDYYVDFDVRYERDHEGRIVSEEYTNDAKTVYEWDEEKGRVARSTTRAEGERTVSVYWYDERGFVAQTISTSTVEETGEVLRSEMTTYTYTKIDRYGNWTELSYATDGGSTGTRTRKIEYYE